MPNLGTARHHFNWKTLSAMAGVTWWNFYFRLFSGSIRSPQVIQFLQHLAHHLDCKLLVVWDAYAPELNPVEYLWSYWKRHELPNFCPQTFWQMSHYARRALRRMRRRTTLVTGFWAQADLF